MYDQTGTRPPNALQSWLAPNAARGSGSLRARGDSAAVPVTLQVRSHALHDAHDGVERPERGADVLEGGEVVADEAPSIRGRMCGFSAASWDAAKRIMLLAACLNERNRTG